MLTVWGTLAGITAAGFGLLTDAESWKSANVTGRPGCLGLQQQKVITTGSSILPLEASDMLHDIEANSSFAKRQTSNCEAQTSTNNTIFLMVSHNSEVMMTAAVYKLRISTYSCVVGAGGVLALVGWLPPALLSKLPPCPRFSLSFVGVQLLAAL